MEFYQLTPASLFQTVADAKSERRHAAAYLAYGIYGVFNAKSGVVDRLVAAFTISIHVSTIKRAHSRVKTARAAEFKAKISAQPKPRAV